MNARILEIFQSTQGEGKYIGVPQVFVRFFECNMHCVWCDTPHSIGDTTRHYKEFTLDSLVSEIKALWGQSHSVSITGGEPLVQADFINTLTPVLRGLGMTVYLETNGVLPKELAQVIDGVDIIAMDIKLPSSTQCRAYWQEHDEFLQIARTKDLFVKVVISNATTKEEVLQAAELVKRHAPDVPFILQPNFFDMKEGVVAKCQEFQNDCLKHLPNVRIIPQIHKFLKVR
ncbi:MAG: 7-carboxy-7-deazaguanine synthase QueE [Candidatus Omnitrophica bacterium]|nr:7-carboxy-7-deazaguanine synthase QueE [Candidatus Omnitrophota bacterium]